MRPFDFNRALVRAPARSAVHGLRSDPHAVPDFEGIEREHALYVTALRTAGLTVDVLPPLEAYPDSVFVEDPALVFPEGAILLRPGAPTRAGESREMRVALESRFDRVLTLKDDEHADGGDVLVTPGTVFIGLSRRTNAKGAAALKQNLAQLGRGARIVEAPPAILHFKTAVSLLSEDTVLATKAMAGSGIFTGFNVLLAPDGEDAAANALRLNDIVLVGERFPKTIDLLARESFALCTLPVTEIGKLDAGLSCMSLRWNQKSGVRSQESEVRSQE